MAPSAGGARAAGPPEPQEDQSNEAVLGRAFDRGDVNNDAVLTLDEVEPQDREKFKWLLRAHGYTEGDGLTREEFIEGPKIDRTPHADPLPGLPEARPDAASPEPSGVGPDGEPLGL